MIDSLDLSSSDGDINLNLDNLDLAESSDDTSFDLLGDNVAETTDLSDDQSDDMNNISAWLENLETPNRNSDDISEWLNQLNSKLKDFDQEDSSDRKIISSKNEAEEISFQFIEDLLEEDSNKNKNDNNE